ncbi:MAG TPA: DUF6471 domain-containing protein [Saprospiraceae bacterium]|nr:DUF6471 domain-containing protein [Saprospiraceae bacterium]HMQ85248.1 DUF6471 domain-containing protein [Saprospiraceae bacterium]
MVNWNHRVKRLLKSELIKRGVSNAELAALLNEIGIPETKSSIDSKISRGSFSACFLLQSLTVIGCSKIEIGDFSRNLLLAAEPMVAYNITSNDEKEQN